jgi:hypothetical protein
MEPSSRCATTADYHCIQNNRANLKRQTSAQEARFVLAVFESHSPGLAHAVGAGFAAKNPEKLLKNG